MLTENIVIKTEIEIEEVTFSHVTFAHVVNSTFTKCIFQNVRFESLDDALFTECFFDNCTFGPCRKTAFVYCVINRTHLTDLDTECTFNLSQLKDVSGIRYAHYGLFLALYQEGKLIFHRYDEESGDVEDWEERINFLVDLNDTAAVFKIWRTRAALWCVSSII
jgi:hypothetical protein